jgi:hypothetical protein
MQMAGSPTGEGAERFRRYCSDVSRDHDESLAATASRIDHWLLVEYRGLWSSDALAGSGLSDQVKARLTELRSAHPRTRLIFIRRPDRRHQQHLSVYVADSREGSEQLGRLEISTRTSAALIRGPRRPPSPSRSSSPAPTASTIPAAPATADRSSTR